VADVQGAEAAASPEQRLTWEPLEAGVHVRMRAVELAFERAPDPERALDMAANIIEFVNGGTIPDSIYKHEAANG
jgi:hypothetical protein